MILTGKAREDFTKWKITNDYIYITTYSKSYNIIENALIIEWLSTKRYSNFNLWEYSFNNAYWNRGMKEYMESVKQAIIRANEIYNENIRTD